MSDVVMKEEDSDTLSVKVKPGDARHVLLCLKELGAYLPPPYKHDEFIPPPLEHPYTHCSWEPVYLGFPQTPVYPDYLGDILPELFANAPESDMQEEPPLISPNMLDYVPPSQIEYIPFISPPFIPCPSYSPTAPGGFDFSQSLDAIHAEPLLFAKIGLHCYNLENGTHFERLGLPRSYDQTIEARDPVRNNYTCRFETNVRLATENKDCFHVITTRSRPSLPPPPPPGEYGFQCGFDSLSVDELFKGNMPDWLPDDYATSTLLMQYYEMKESEVEQAKDWLHLYAELALYTKMQTDPFMFERSKPLELGKVVVQTRDSMKDVKLSDNAVFFITFKTSGGDVCKGIIRRTRDGIPEHLSLEAKCFM